MAPKSIPFIYTLLFLYLEPLSLLAGVYYTLFSPHQYLKIVHAVPPSATSASFPLPSASNKPLDHSTTILVTQLANVYFLFFLTESLVLRTTSELRVWKVFMAALMVADGGHLGIVWWLGGGIGAGAGAGEGGSSGGSGLGLGLEAADWVKPAVMMVARGLFLMGVGIRGEKGKERKR